MEPPMPRKRQDEPVAFEFWALQKSSVCGLATDASNPPKKPVRRKKQKNHPKTKKACGIRAWRIGGWENPLAGFSTTPAGAVEI